MSMPSYLQQVPAITQLMQKADHIDVKSVVSHNSFRQFVAGFLDYQPAWVTLLYGMRMAFVRLLGLKQVGLPRPPQYTPDQLPTQIGEKAAFFTVRAAAEGKYWAADIDDSHLRATVAVVAEPLNAGETRYYVITIVHYHNWAGPVYFNVIRPFHHLVVGSMMHAGAS